MSSQDKAEILQAIVSLRQEFNAKLERIGDLAQEIKDGLVALSDSNDRIRSELNTLNHWRGGKGENK